MTLYSGFGLIIASDFELPELPLAEGSPDVIIRRDRIAIVRRPASPTEELRVFRFSGAFRILNGCEIIVDPLPNADETLLRLILLGSVMAFLLRQRGWLPLHGSGVAIDGRAVLFLGSCGSGKSTTAAAFHLGGHLLISDDLCAVRVNEERCWVQTALPRIRLLPEPHALIEGLGGAGPFEFDKHSYRVSSPATAGLLQVERIYILEFGETCEIVPVPPLEAVAMVSINSFSIRRRMNREALQIHVEDCARVSGATRIARLVRTRSISELGAVLRGVAEDLKRD